MALRVSSDGTSDKGVHTIADLRAFLKACDDLNMPDSSVISGKTKITGSGPLKTLTAEWLGATPVAMTGPSVAPNPELTIPRANTPLIPGLPDRPDDQATRPLPPVTGAPSNT
jgi:hypothetical protein